MICPDTRQWHLLVAHRLDPDVPEPPEWVAAEEHLRRCGDCRGEALAADPTLLFQGLRAPATGDGEVAAMRGAVAALRGAERVEGRSRASWAQRGRRAAAAAAVFAALSLGASAWLDVGAPQRHVQEHAATAAAAAPEAMLAASGVFDPAAAAALGPIPVWEDLDSPGSRFYQLAEDPGFQMVMIVNERFGNL